MKELNYTACARPNCSCPTIETIEDVDGNQMIQITDDYNGSVIMTIEEMYLLAKEFIVAYKG